MTRFAIVCCLGWLFGSATLTAAEPLKVGRARQLFFDDSVVDSMQGLERHWHQPEKASVPVHTRERPWEGRGPYLYGTVLRDPPSGSFKVWYNCYVGGRPDYYACYATSRDGLHWERPACDAVRDPRLPEGNNVVMLGSGLADYRQCLSPSVLIRPDEPDPARRYAMLYWDINAGRTVRFFGLCLAYSQDGIHWTNAPGNPVFDGASDVTDACYDPVGRRYLLHYKMWRVEGEVVASKIPRGTAGRVTYWPTWDTIALDEGKVRFQGRLVDYTADDTNPMTAAVDFAREPVYRRVVARAESKDLIHWTNARLVFELPEKGDPPGLSTYGMPVFPYEGRYVGLLRVFHDEREIDLELVHSPDDRQWKRPNPGKPFLPLGPGGQFDSGMVFSSNAPVTVGDELWFYFGAFTGHHAVADENQSCAIGLARLRRDGFVSLAAGDDSGDFVSVPLRCEGDRLLINAAADRGNVSVEIRDEKGAPRPGFTFADCDEFRGDAVSHAVAWRGKPDLSRVQGQIVRLAFQMRRARLYAFQFDAAPAR